MRNHGWIKRVIAGFMVMVMCFMVPSVHVHGATKQVTYIKDFKLYVIKNDNKIESFDKAAAAEKAKKWFSDNGYTMVEGNLNEDASGLLNKEVGVFIGYSTTTDPSEAVMDIALMNEQGGYSQADFKMMLDRQKKVYTQMVDDMQTMIDGYRTNYKAGQPTAIQAHDNLNTYYEDDSQKMLGDYLLECSRDDLTKTLLQANTEVVQKVEEMLVYAGEGKSSTWLDRMSKLGSYQKLEDTYIAKYKGDKNAALRAMKETYNDTAIDIEYMWPVLKGEIDGLESYRRENRLESMSEAELKNFLDERNEDQNALVYIEREKLVGVLRTYKYGDGTLYDFFKQSTDKIAGENIKELYPIAASLTATQRASLEDRASVISLIRSAVGATVFNNYNTPVSKAFAEAAEKNTSAKNELDNKEKKIEELEKTLQTELKASVYEGVDREIFTDGAAITSKAMMETKANDSLYKQSFLDGNPRTYELLTGVSTILSGLGLMIFVKMQSDVEESLVETAVRDRFHELLPIEGTKPYNYVDDHFEELIDLGKNFNSKDMKLRWESVDKAKKILKKGPAGTYEETIKAGYNSMHGDITKATYYSVKGLKIGFAVLFTALAAADIYFTVRAIMDYYNRDHLEIPHHIRDVNSDPTAETSYIDYTSVRDQDGNPGDVNGGGGKQWLALYQTKNKNAGKPLIAPESGGKIYIKTGEGADKDADGQDIFALHMFETPNVAQNLTDEKAGYSFNDKKGGIYLYFTRGDAVIENGETDGSTGTAVSTGYLVIVGVGGLIIGIVIGLVVANYSRKRKKA
ncbi:MAG: hypothetical protein J6P16_05250 [Eubacterium sp.]|nr:hypothetical protein [Eubacterium sp.]